MNLLYAVIVVPNLAKYNVRLVKFLLKPTVFTHKVHILCYDAAAGMELKGKTHMGYYDHKRNVEKYIAMMAGFDNSHLIETVFDNLPSGKSMLELGMGAGLDFALLKKAYTATGSDSSKAFLDAYRKIDPSAPLLRLDAVNIATDQTFDYIYSNKVLIHLTDEALKASFKNQAARLTTDGLVFHTFWYGTDQNHFHGLLFNNHTPEEIVRISAPWFSPVRDVRYTEMDPDDSFYIVLKKK